MTAHHRERLRDPIDGLDSYQVGDTTTEQAERDLARDALVRRATSMRDLGHLLGLLGLNQPDEIQAQLAHRPQGETA